jgi:hypothetical protein
MNKQQVVYEYHGDNIGHTYVAMGITRSPSGRGHMARAGALQTLYEKRVQIYFSNV